MQVRPFKAIDSTSLGAARAQLEPLIRQLNGPLQDLSQAVSRNLTLRDNLAVSLKSVTVTVPDPWVTLSLVNGWSPFASTTLPTSTPAVMKDGTGRVWLRGAIKGGTIGATAVVLAAPYRPPLRELKATIGDDAIARFNVTTLGEVVPVIGTGATYYSLETSWMAADATPLAASCWPQIFSWDLPGQCIGVVPLSIYVLDPANKGVPLANVSACSALPSWQQTSAGSKPQINILNQPLLAPGKSYSITYACFAG